jgi:DNA-binding FrmR family transcriptional regulator
VADRLRRVDGQVRGIARMIEEGHYCLEVLTQLCAVHGALDEVERILLRDCLGRLTNAGAPAEREQAIGEILTALGRGRR